jgi:Tfp pilus assembly protein PilO
MPDLRTTRKNIKSALAVLLGLDVVAAAVLFSPLVGSTESRRVEMNQLWVELQAKTTQLKPLGNLDQKVLAANQQIADFYKRRLPSQDSQISTQLGNLAAESGVSLDAVKYKPVEAEIEQLELVELDADLSGSYVQVARFINALERSDMLFIIDGIELVGEQKGIRLQMKLETYLKAGS